MPESLPPRWAFFFKDGQDIGLDGVNLQIDGVSQQVFLEVSLLFGDVPALADMTFAIGHSGMAPRPARSA